MRTQALPDRRRARQPLAAAALSVILLTGCSSGTTTSTEPGVGSTTSAPASTPAGSTAPAADKSVASVVADFVDDSDGGVAVLTIRDGVTTTFGIGIASASGQSIVAATPFRVGSISKPFIATIVLQLVEGGRVDLDEPLSSYLLNPVVGADVTVRELLSHRSGLPNYTDQSGFIPAILADRNRTYSPDDILEFVEDETVAPANQSFNYSNTNYILLGQLIEQVTGTELAAALRTRIAEPLSLNATLFPVSESSEPGNLAAGWSPRLLVGDSTAPYESIASSAWAAGALISTTGDLARFLTGLFHGELISEELLAEMTDVADDGYGLGLFAARLGPDRPGYAHSGSIPGYTSTMAIDPVSGDVLVILTNNDTLVADLLAPRILMAW